MSSTKLEVEGFLIYSGGDRSVGIFPARWELKGGFNFDSLEDKQLFMNQLKDTYISLVADDVSVYEFGDPKIDWLL